MFSDDATFPAIRVTNRSPKPWSKTISIGTRESAQPKKAANGVCVVRLRVVAQYCGGASVRHRRKSPIAVVEPSDRLLRSELVRVKILSVLGLGRPGLAGVRTAESQADRAERRALQPPPPRG